MPTPSSQPAPKFDFAEPSNRTPPISDAFKAAPPGALSRIQPPPPTPIYPQPISPPPAATIPVSPPAPTPVSRPGARTGGRIAGGFRMPPSAGVAARASAATVGRRIPYVALAFLAYDAYQLACGLQLIPGSVCPRPDNPSPGGVSQSFNGGQSAGIVYNVTYEMGGSNFKIEDTQAYYGSIISVRFEVLNGGNTLYFITSGGKASFGYRPPFFEDQITNYFGMINPFIRILNIRRVDNLPDTGGNPQPKPAPQAMPDQINNIINFNRNININFTVPKPAPPSPQPKPAPRIISPPSPFPDININFGDNYFGGGDTDYDFDIDFNFSPAPKGNFNDYPDIFNNFPPSPQPQTKDPDPFPKDNPPPQPAPQPKPLPEIPPPIPDKLPDNSTDQDRYIYRQNKETLDKLYKANAEILEIQKEQKKQSKILENIQNLLDFEVEGSQLIKRCDDIEIFYSYKDKVLKAISKQLDHVKAIEQTIINEVCSIEASTVIASPDWWGVRLQADVPQICLIFRVALSRTYHRLTIPHPLNTTKLLVPPIETYEKGNWMAEIMCIDNSKFIGNFKTKEEAIRIGNIALSLIHPDWKGENPRVYLAERKGVAVAEGTMKATSAMYFATGQKNMMPDWRVPFKLDGI